MCIPFRRTAVCGLFVAAIATSQTAPLANQIAAHLTANDLKADVSFLASDALQGRGTPSSGLDIAAEYIAAQYRRAGLEPAGDDGYFQSASFVNETPNAEGLQLTIEANGKQIPVAAPAMSIGQGAAVDLHGAAAYYTADAAALAQLTPEQVRGKVLVLNPPNGSRPRLGAAVLARLQPALVILLAAGAPPAMTARPQLREAAASIPPTLFVWDAPAREALAGAKPGPVEMTISAHIAAPSSTPVKLRNVIGVLRGADPALRDTYVLVTAHYDHLGVRGTGPGDHIYNGANDDASGTACVIEMAQALAALPARPKRSIVFLTLFGEEMGLLGSRYYGAHPVFPLDKTVADLNLEQMGRTDDNTGPRVGVVNVTGFDYSSITPVLAKAGEEFGIQVLKDEQASDPFFARSDNQALADAGVPAHTLSVGYVFPDYHQPGDEWPKIDYENMAKVDRTAALGVWRIADSTEAPQWNVANPKTERYVKARGGK
jgi:Peptidase family M28